MKKSIKWILIIIGISTIAFVMIIGTCLFLFFMPTNDRDNHDSARTAEMKEITLEWARLAPFPQDARDFTIRTEGNMFTRTFVGSFTAPGQSIKSWVKRSAGLQDAETESISKGKVKYIIKPGGGANSAEVIIDYNSGSVEFVASWS